MLDLSADSSRLPLVFFLGYLTGPPLHFCAPRRVLVGFGQG